MMPRNGKGHLRLPSCKSLFRSGGGVVHPLRAAGQPPLESRTVFPDVMQHSGQICLLRRAKSFPKTCRQHRRVMQMLVYGLGTCAILADVRVSMGWGRYIHTSILLRAAWLSVTANTGHFWHFSPLDVVLFLIKYHNSPKYYNIYFYIL